MQQRSTGLEYWRSLEQLAGSEEVRRQLEEEFPGYDPEGIRSLSRRRFMQIMGASMALAGLTLSGCRRWPKERLAPYASNPPDRIIGQDVQYATIMELGGIAQGLLATSFDGRPIKLEGNPTHPFSQGLDPRLGSADAYAQASVLELYDPERSRFVLDRTGAKPTESSWDRFVAALGKALDAARGKQGAGLAILSEITDSPSVAYLKAELLKAYPKANWVEYGAVNRDNETAGLKQAYGQPLRPFLHLDSASVIVLFDADLLGTHPAHIRYGVDWARRRRSADDRANAAMSRVYLAESRFSTTGSVADERLPVRPSKQLALVQALAAALGVQGVNKAPAEALSAPEQAFIAAAAADLKGAGAGKAVVAAGPSLPPEAHAAIAAINDALGAVGKTVTYLQEPNADRRGAVESISDLAAQIKSGSVQSLLILGGNPAYDAPADLDFAARIAAVPFSVHLSIYADETSNQCKWHVPRAHYLESWGDGRAWDGSASVQQPLILPLFGGKSSIELLAVAAGDKLTDGEAIVRRTFESFLDKGDFERQFRRVLHDGILPGTAGAEVKPTAVLKAVAGAATTAAAGYEVRFYEDYCAYDGRFAHNAWLQEMPDPLTKIAWDNAALLSKADADKLGVTNGDMIAISLGGRSLEIAVYIMPGQPGGVIGLPLGYGRQAGSHIGIGIGFNTYGLRSAAAPHHAAGAEVRKTGGTYLLAMTQAHFLIDEIGFEGRQVRIGEKHKSGKIIHEASFAEYKANPTGVFTNETGRVSLQLYNPPAKFNEPHAWGMAIDMNACMGCNACTIACQAENNIPVVGKEMVIRNREMNWLRIDRYFKGDKDDPNPQVTYQPMACQHCENAPCEQVCPVGATMHDTEGLNVMVYNRCIGTRYCSNNCPYKVRRFNYFDWHSKDPRGMMMPWLSMPDEQQREQVNKFHAMVYNPDVTVRMRGVMEKCTYCIQRIHKVTIAKRGTNEPVNDGDIVTACQQACPTQAIVFGNLNDTTAKVTQLHQNPRTYSVLDEALNTQPRTKYLAKLRNPSDALAKTTATTT
jgi:molybdopterin-containing oxidoreductase family iron-sulfur binding subunit